MLAPPPAPAFAADGTLEQANVWDDPPLAAPNFASPAPTKTPWYKLAPRKPKAPADGAPGAVTAGTVGQFDGVAAPAAVTPAPVTSPAPAPADDAKTPWYKLAPRTPKAATATTAGAAAADASPAAPAPVTAPAPSPVASTPPAHVVPAPGVPPAAPVDTKTPWYKLAPRKPKGAAGAVVTATGVAAATAPPPGPGTGVPVSTAPAQAAPSTMERPPAAPLDPVPLAVQPPPPGRSTPAGAAATGPVPYPAPAGGPGGVVPPGGTTGDGGASDVVLAGAANRPNRTLVLGLVAAIVVVLAGGAAYVVSKRNNPSTPPTPAAVTPAASPAADTALAGSVNLRLSDLPAGWTQTPPAQAVVRPPVAPAVAQSDATNTMATCLSTSYSLVSGLFGSGSLPNQTSLVQSPTFQSAAGTAMEMGSKTMTMASPGQVQALDAVFTNPKFDVCFQQFVSALAAGAVPGATVQVQPVTLTGPAGVQTYGVVSTYTLPGTGTEVVGDAYMLGGRVVTELQPSTNGPAIPGGVFTPAYDAVVGRVAAAATK